MSRKWKYFHRSIFFRFKRKYFSLNALKMEILYKDSEYNKNLLKLSTLKTVVTFITCHLDTENLYQFRIISSIGQ